MQLIREVTDKYSYFVVIKGKIIIVKQTNKKIIKVMWKLNNHQEEEILNLKNTLHVLCFMKNYVVFIKIHLYQTFHINSPKRMNRYFLWGPRQEFRSLSRGTKVEKMLTLAPERYTAGFCMVAKVILWCI